MPPDGQTAHRQVEAAVGCAAARYGFGIALRTVHIEEHCLGTAAAHGERNAHHFRTAVSSGGQTRCKVVTRGEGQGNGFYWYVALFTLRLACCRVSSRGYHVDVVRTQ